MDFSQSLPAWLEYIQSIHHREIDMGLERIQKVAQSLAIAKFSKSIVIAGTNGKGTTAAFMSSLALAHGWSVGSYTSPHLIRYNERIRINGMMCADDEICYAFTEIETARGAVPLTYFEYSTLCAFFLFAKHAVDCVVLEVGLGGRKDAVNIIDADISIITEIDLDHQEWLGDTREEIAMEKAGIMRTGKPCLSSDPNPPVNLLHHADAIGAELLLIGEDFQIQPFREHWQLELQLGQTPPIILKNLPYPTKITGPAALRSCATAIIAFIRLLVDVSKENYNPEIIRQAITSTKLIGRLMHLAKRPEIILDVAHNRGSIDLLATHLAERPVAGKTHGVFSMLAGKPLKETARRMADHVDCWHVAEIQDNRKLPLSTLITVVYQETGKPVIAYGSLLDAYLAAYTHTQKSDQIVVFGSFFVVGAILTQLESESPQQAEGIEF